MREHCAHMTAETVTDAPRYPEAGCADCAADGFTDWVALRMCVQCGHVGCCDSSPHRHATAHFSSSGHPVMRSVEADDDWGWCYVDEGILVPAPSPGHAPADWAG